MAMAVAASSAITTVLATPNKGGFSLATSRQPQSVSARLAQFSGLRMCNKMQVTARKTWKPRAMGCPSLKIFAITAGAETLETVQEVIAKQLSIELETVMPETKFADLGADSLDTVEIMMALEEKFDISIGEGGAENIATVQDAADLIEKIKAEGA